MGLISGLIKKTIIILIVFMMCGCASNVNEEQLSDDEYFTVLDKRVENFDMEEFLENYKVDDISNQRIKLWTDSAYNQNGYWTIDEGHLEHVYVSYDAFHLKKSDITLFSSDPSVLEVDRRGVIHAKKAGDAVIFAKYCEYSDFLIYKVEGVESIDDIFGDLNFKFTNNTDSSENATQYGGGGSDVALSKIDSVNISSSEVASRIEELSAAAVASANIVKNAELIEDLYETSEATDINYSELIDRVTPPNETASSEDDVQILVWLTQTGECYHSKNDCGLTNSEKAWQVPEDKAISYGYRPCSNCY